MTSQSLAAQGGFGSASAATKQLKKVGLSPILPVELARQAIFRRTDAEAALDRWQRRESGAPRATEH
jgi:Rod binding domain-containing protein